MNLKYSSSSSNYSNNANVPLSLQLSLPAVNSQWVKVKQYANHSQLPTQENSLMKQLAILIQQVHQNSPLITEAHKRKAVNRLRDILFSQILSNSIRLKLDNVRLDRENLKPYLPSSSSSVNYPQEDTTISTLHRKITSITFEMRSRNEYTKALSLEVLISHIIEKPKSAWKCYNDYTAQTLKTTDKSSILQLIIILADAADHSAIFAPHQSLSQSAISPHQPAIATTSSFQPSQLSITNTLVNSLLTERNLLPGNKHSQELQKKTLNLFRFGSGASTTRAATSASYASEAGSSHPLIYKPCVQAMLPLCRKSKCFEEGSEGQSSTTSTPTSNAVGQFSSSIVETDIFNLRKGPILPELSDYAMQAQLGYSSQTKEFTDYSRLFTSDMSSSRVSQSGKIELEMSKNKKDGVGFPVSVFELNKNTNDNMQSLMGAFSRKQEDKQAMPFAISLSIPSIGSKREYNPLTAFAQLNTKKDDHQPSLASSAFSKQSQFMPSSSKQPLTTMGLNHNNNSSLIAPTLWHGGRVDQTVISEQIPSFYINQNGGQQDNPMSLSQLDHSSFNQNSSRLLPQSSLKATTPNNLWMNKEPMLTENQFVLNPTQLHHLTMNQSILEQNITNQLKSQEQQQHQQMNQTTLSSVLREEAARGEKRRFGFQKVLEHCNNDITRILTHESNLISSSLWEDYDIRKSKIQNKNLSISSSAIFTKDKCAELIVQSNKHFANLLLPEPLLVEEQYVLHRTILMLQGIESELFILHSDTCEFTLNQLSITLSTITHETLNIFLNRFIEPGTKTLRLYEILKLFRPNKFKSPEFQEVISLVEACMECWESQILELAKQESPCTTTLMEMSLELRESFRQIDLIYELLFSKYMQETQFQFDIRLAYAALPSSTNLLNALFQKLCTDALCQLDHSILFTFFSRILQPLSSNLTSVVLFATNENIIYKNLPSFLLQTFPRIEECAMNLALMKASDMDHFNACSKVIPEKAKIEEFTIQVAWDISRIKTIEAKYTKLFAIRKKSINELLNSIRYQKELKNAEEMKQKLEYIAHMKESYRQRIAEIEAKKREEHAAKLRKAKEESNEIELRRVQKKYERLLAQEKEKAIMLDNQLKERVRVEQQKFDLLQLKLREAQSTGVATDSAELDKTTSELRLLYERAINNDTSLLSVSSEDPSIKTIYEDVKMKMEVEEQQVREQDVAEQTAFLNRLYEEKQMLIESEEPNQLGEDNIHEQNETTHLLIEQVQASNTTNKNNQMEVEQEIELEQEEIEAGGVSTAHNIPISVIVSACVSNVIQQQAALTNAAVLNLVFDKYSMGVMLEFLKKYMLCERGDKIDYFLDVIIKENGRIEILSLYEASSILFDEEDFIRPLNQYTPYLEFQKDDAPFQAYNIFQTNLSSLLKLRIKNLPKIMEVIFNEESLASYLSTFSHFIKFRYASKLLQQKWKQINKFILDQRTSRHPYDQYDETFKQKNRLGRLAQSLRHKIQHFMTTFQAYAYYDIVENAWGMLNRSLSKCRTIQDLIIIHSNYMKYIQAKTFMKTLNQKIEQYLAEILSILVQFVNILERVISMQTTYFHSTFFAEDDEEHQHEQAESFETTIAKLSALSEKFASYEEFLSQLIEKMKENENLQSEITAHLSGGQKTTTATHSNTNTTAS